MLKCTPSHTWGPRSLTAPDGLTVGRHPLDPRHAGAGLDWVRVEASAGWGSCLGDRVAQVPRVGPATASGLDGVQCRSPLWHRGAEPRPLAGLLLEAHRAGRSRAAVRRQETAVSDHTPRTPLAAVGDLVLSLPGGGPAAELREAGEPAQATWPVAAPHSAGLLLPSCALGPLRPRWPRLSPLVDRTEVRAPAWRPRYDKCLPPSRAWGQRRWLERPEKGTRRGEPLARAGAVWGRIPGIVLVAVFFTVPGLYLPPHPDPPG